MKTLLLALTALVLIGTLGACSTGAAVNTPILDVGVGGAVE